MANGNLQQVIGLLDSGNSLASKCYLRTDIAEKLGLKIIRKSETIGSASSKSNLNAVGYTTLKMYLKIEGQNV